MHSMTEFGGVELQKTDLNELASTRTDLDPAAKEAMLKSAEKLVPKEMKYIIEGNVEDDPAYRIALAVDLDQQLMLV